jgi:nucleotide-binding universal stress UspA family protein
VLLATDGTGATDATFFAAQAVADRLGTGVDVIGVLEPLPSYLAAAPLPDQHLEHWRIAALDTAIRRRLDGLHHVSELWPVSIHLGETARTIARVASLRTSSVVIVGLGSHSFRDRVLGGERALRVVRGADRPVLAVAPDFHALPQTIVVGVDFSPASVRAARLALAMLGDSGRLVLVHVEAEAVPLPLPPSMALSESDAFSRLSRWEEEDAAVRARLFDNIRRELRPHTPDGVTIETRTRRGGVLDELFAAAEEESALIAVGTHSSGVFERVFLGSVAADVIRHSGRSVLVAPPPPATEAARLELRLRGTSEVTTPVEWEPLFAAFSQRNAGRLVRLEVDDPELGALVHESGFAFLGVAYDRRDERIEIMVGDPRDGRRHLTRTITEPSSVAFYAGGDGREQALRVAHGTGQTLLTFIA